MSDIYSDGTYLESNSTWHVEDSPWKANHILKIIKRNNLAPSTICEIGCGAGEILNQLHAQLPPTIAFTGYEISPDVYKAALTRKKENLEFHLKDVLEEEAYYDIVLIIDIIEHVPDFYGFLNKVRGKGNYKIFHIPLDLSVQTVARSKPIIYGRKKVGHIHYFTKETALAALQDSGYTIVDYFYTAPMVDLPGRSLKSRVLKLPRIALFNLSPDLAVRVLGGYSLMVLTK